LFFRFAIISLTIISLKSFNLVSTHYTALVKITNDLLMAADSGLSILILLDLTTAFDTISHHALLNHLASIGINNATLSWFTSYFHVCHVLMMEARKEDTGADKDREPGGKN